MSEKDTKINSETIVGFTPRTRSAATESRCSNLTGPGPALILTGVFDVYSAQKK